ncbi:MAG: DUF1667 domain-containing protein [Synergistaceae bacterium]|nr:DUF1667 domain-containing protein [Synergistaceae bacterium]
MAETIMKDLTCIRCPMGCLLHTEKNGDIITVTGNTCPAGKAYAEEELTEPKRIVTSIVKVANRTTPLSVKTSVPIPKDKIFAIMEQIMAVVVTPPVKIGNVIIKNVLDTGADIVATKNID